MRSVLTRIGGQYAFHQRVVLPLLALLSFGTAFADSERAADAVPSLWIAIAAIAGFAAWALFSLLAIAGSRIPRSRPTARGLVAIVIYGVTEAFRAVLVALLAVQFGQATVVNYPFRIVAGGLTGLVLFAMVAILLNDGWAYRAQRVRLNEVQRELQQALRFRKVDLEQRFAELVDAVRAAVHNALKSDYQPDPRHT